MELRLHRTNSALRPASVARVEMLVSNFDGIGLLTWG